ncbi:MAG TPA: VOC family protein [Gammaproteobacteria bacterium]|nr:VOC family protein [Gammaproteobacteria bacterium]
MANATVRGRFVWHELYTPNRAGSQEFYGKVAGWAVQSWEQDPAYQMFAAKSGPLGGVVEERSGTPQWLAYIGTTDVDATADAATRLGGRVQTAPADLPNGGRYAVIVDPQGATFGVHGSATAPQPETAPKAGEFSWHELATSVAPGVAFGFYAALFDWDLMAEHDMGPMGIYLVFGRNGRQLGGIFDKGAQGKPGGAYWLGYVSVTDLEGAVERAKGARGSVLMGPMDVPGGDRVAQLMDPYGAFFALHKPASQGAAAESGKPAARAPAKKPATKKAAKPAKKAAAKVPKPAARKKAKKAPAKKKAARKPAKARPKKKAAKKAKKRR